MNSLLLIEDDEAMAAGLSQILRPRGYVVSAAHNGLDGLRRAREEEFSLIVLDVALPGMNGFEVLRALRSGGSRVPVVLLTGRGSEMDKVLGFELGVDDYVTKPFSVLELIGRIQAVLRRCGAASEALQLGPVTVDLKAYRIHNARRTLDLPARAYDLLGVLARHPGQAVTRDALMDAVWGTGAAVNLRTVDNLVVKLRQAIEENPESPRHLFTIHGVGYRLDFSS